MESLENLADRALHFAIDSREVIPGTLFFALKGEVHDGHSFLKEVAEKGAYAAVVDHFQKDQDIVQIVVPDVLSALQSLAKRKRTQQGGICIGITGSVGKTTTKEFIATLLEKKFNVLKTLGNANSQVGLSLSILNQKGTPDVFIAEMGMTNHGHISKLIEISPPNLVVVTKIALAHAAFFPDGIEEIATAKSEILESSCLERAFINIQVKQFKAFQKPRKFPTIFYDGSEMKSFSLPFIGAHLRENFAVASLVAQYLGMSEEEIETQSQFLKPYKQRYEIFSQNGVTYVNDCYNANEASVRAALESLPKPQSYGKTIAVLGEMRELGKFSEEVHRKIGEIAAQCVDVLICLKPETYPMFEAFQSTGRLAFYMEDLKSVKRCLDEHLSEGDVVLVKGSKSLKMWGLLEGLDNYS